MDFGKAVFIQCQYVTGKTSIISGYQTVACNTSAYSDSVIVIETIL
jgi:hypothetical protein